MTKWLAWVALSVAACGGDVKSSRELFVCSDAPAPLTLTYTSVRGSCGEVPQELVALPDGLESCDVRQTTSADRCSTHLEYECLTSDGAGTQAWVLDFEQVGPSLTVLRSTLEIHHAAYAGGYCRGEYEATLTPR